MFVKPIWMKALSPFIHNLIAFPFKATVMVQKYALSK